MVAKGAEGRKDLVKEEALVLVVVVRRLREFRWKENVMKKI